MRYQDRQRGQGHQPESSGSEASSPRSVSPGKQTLAMTVPPQPASTAAPAQLERNPAADAARADNAALTEQWTSTAMRPDLYAQPVQRKSSGKGQGSAAAHSPSGSGQPLPENVRGKMERAFKTNFSAVRVYEGQEAVDAGALAYTKGTNIHFAPGQYQPQTPKGQKLLAHELKHVEQQAQGRVQATMQAKGLAINDDSSLEREADRKAEEVMQQEGSAAAEDAAHTPVQASASSSSGAVIQRYVADNQLAPGMVSDGGHLAVTGKQEAYASDEKLAEAQAALAQTTARITVERGTPFQPVDAQRWQQAFGDRQLYRINPVYKADTPANQTTHEPVAGENAQDRQTKLTAYKASLTQGLTDISNLYTQIATAWHAAEQQQSSAWLGSIRYESPGQVVHGQFIGRVVATIASTMGAAWSAHELARPVLNPRDKSALTLKHFSDLFSALFQAFTDKIATDLADESAMQELLMSLPNDCKQASMLLTGKDAAALSQVNENPGVGDNYYKSFGTEYGWRTHYATVIAKDTHDGNTDNLTFEAAADFQAKVEKGKSLGFFEMYGTQTPEQTFEYRILEKQRAYIGRQTAAELANADQDQQNKITADRDADYAKIDARLQEMREE